MRVRLALVLCALLWSALGQAQEPKILLLGDSLGASYGVPVTQGWVTLLQQRLMQKGYPHKIVNASVSGDTTAGGRTRLAEDIRTYQPQIVLIELGGNDGLRGLPVAKMRENLEAMVQLCQEMEIRPVLFEMRIPDNYGKDYVSGFAGTFSSVAQETHTPLVPFFLAGIAGDRAKWFQEDGIHPTAEAQPKLLDAVWPTLEKVLGRNPAHGGKKKK
ncbi:MAG TPA: arylesterase [Nevskiaceae bacterium]|nr:arylesterase [Nevskiaceae bacterium]